MKVKFKLSRAAQSLGTVKVCGNVHHYVTPESEKVKFDQLPTSTFKVDEDSKHLG